MSSYRRSLYWQGINDGYSTMSDGIFLIVHRTFLLSYFVILEASGSCVCAQNMWTYNEAAIELAAAVLIKRLQQHGH